MNDRPTYIIHLRADDSTTDGTRAMRQLLKIALRRFGLRCTSITNEPPPIVTGDARGRRHDMPTSADRGDR